MKRWSVLLICGLLGVTAPSSAADWLTSNLNGGGHSAYTWNTVESPVSTLSATDCAVTVFSYEPDINNVATDATAELYSCTRPTQDVADCDHVLDMKAEETNNNQVYNKPGYFKLVVTGAPSSGAAQVSAFCDKTGRPRTAQSWPEILHETINSSTTREIARNPNRIALIIHNTVGSSHPIFVGTTGGGLGAPISTSGGVGIPVYPGQTLELGGAYGWDVITEIGTPSGTTSVSIRVSEVLTIRQPVVGGFTPEE